MQKIVPPRTLSFSNVVNYEQLKIQLCKKLSFNPNAERIALFTLDGTGINNDSDLRQLGINAEIVAKIVPNPPAAAAHPQPNPQPHPRYMTQLTLDDSQGPRRRG